MERRCRLTLEQIKDELLNGRDLSKKGSRKRQLEYGAQCPRQSSASLRRLQAHGGRTPSMKKRSRSATLKAALWVTTSRRKISERSL